MSKIRYSNATPLERALACAAQGWRVFPVKRATKSPAMRAWPDRATCDVDTLYRWFDPNHNARWCDQEVGIATGAASGIWVIDVDTHWTNGRRSLAALFRSHGVTEPPVTFRVMTPSGGEQWYVRYPVLAEGDERRIRNVASAPDRPGPLGPGIDVRGERGQVVSPGGLGRDVIVDAEPFETPPWLLELVLRRESPPSDTAVTVTSASSARELLERRAAALAETSSGGRNHELNRVAFELGHLVGLLSQVDITDALMEACRTNGLLADDGEEQCRATIASGWRAGSRTGATQ